MRAHLCTWLALLLLLLAGAAPVSAQFIPLGDLPGGIFDSAASAVSADGMVAVGSSVSGSSSPLVEAFRWTQATGMVGLGFLPGHSETSRASDVSANGSIVVGASGDIGEAFRWTQATGMVGLGFLPGGSSSIALGVSADGLVTITRST
jgi:probable HAF family extracellular repeat protein